MSPSLYGNECWSFANLVLFEGSQILQLSDIVAEPPILLELTQNSELAYDRDHFLQCVLEDMR